LYNGVGTHRSLIKSAPASLPVQRSGFINSAVGLNWYPNSNIRVMLDYSWIDVDRLDTSGASIGQQVEAVGMRVQAAY
jgi:Phosphate-selective porin O and P